MATTDRKRKRDTNEEENNNTNMDTEQNSSVQFSQLNPSELKVIVYKCSMKFYISDCLFSSFQ